ncbi:hypothetical protein IGI39_000024 [Enterococcus sp. AZ135]|uniref:DUF2922 family protein n=1 Tax=unclassified Enterococcus TaxID=2608891 RepID=UPI003F1F55F7
MKKDLVVKFANSLGKNHDCTYKDLNPDLPIPAIKEACELLTTLDIFEQNGVKLFASVVTAKIVDTYERDVFDVEKEPMIVENEANEPETIKDAAPFKAPENYDYLFEPSKAAIAQKLDGPVKTTKELPSLTINAPQLEKRSLTNNKSEYTATDTSDPISIHLDEREQKDTKKGFLAWFRRRKNRNKDDPDIRPRGSEPPK